MPVDPDAERDIPFSPTAWNAWRIRQADRRPADPTKPDGETWGAYKSRVNAEAMANHATSEGICNECGLAFRLHPPERQVTTRWDLCAKAIVASQRA